VLEEGNRSDAFVVILAGRAEVVRGDERVNELGPGEFIGEVGLVLSRTRNASVRAVTDMLVLVADAGRFKQLLDEVPGMARAVLDTLEDRLAEN